jgi:Zn-dependent peptidase ImmA (M78 family)
LRKTIKEIVDNLVLEFGTNDVYELCECLEIEVDYDKLGDKIKGFFVNVSSKPFIKINSTLDEWERRVVLAHELGHFFMHPSHNICRLQAFTYNVTNKLEHDANEFATHLLVRESELEILKSEVEILTDMHISQHFVVPVEFVRYIRK